MCDIDCCCDIDCTERMLKTFVCNEKMHTIHDYDYFTPLPSCQLETSLFCVVHENPHPSDNQKFDLNLRQNLNYKWPQLFVSPTDHGQYEYQVGDSIYVYDESLEEVKTFGMFFHLFFLLKKNLSK